MIEEVVVLLRSSASVDPGVLERFCRSVSTEIGLPVRPVVVEGSAGQIDAIEQRTAETAVVVIGDELDAQRDVLGVARTAPDVVWVDLDSAQRPRDDEVVAAGIRYIRGRGLEGVRWAARAVVARAAAAVHEESYGGLPDQVGDLRMPEGDGPHPVVVLIHGGAWRERWERDLMDSIAVDLTARGYATWNLEYRRVGPAGGGWPNTFADVAAGIDSLSRLAGMYSLDTARVALMGHSAGGHLALWAAGRGALPADAPGADPEVVPTVLVSLAGVTDLVEIGRRGNEESATTLFMGGLPDELPDEYALASPLARLPLGSFKQQIVYGLADRVDLVDANRRYVLRAQGAGDDVEELAIEAADHFHVIDPRSVAWPKIVAAFERAFPVSVEGGVGTAVA
jgi:acetyl esterase/lipase